MTDEKALFAAILAHPLEDTPRLAYADWLDEHGGEPNTHRAAFIRLSIKRDAALAALDEADEPRGRWADQATTDRFTEMEKRERAEWRKVLCGRKGPLRGRACHFHFGRGFPQRTSAPSDRLIAEGEALFRLTPVVELSAREVTAENLPPLLARPWLAGVHHLSLNGRWETAGSPPDYAALARGPRLGALEVLWFDRGSLWPVGAREWVAANPFPRLRKFQASDVPLNDAAPVLFGSKEWGNIDEVYAHQGGLKASGVSAVMNSRTLTRLRKLSLPSSPLAAGAVQALTAGVRWRDLEELVLYGTGMSSGEVWDFAKAPPTALASLTVSMNRIGPDAASVLAGSRLMTGLRVLDVGGNPLFDAGAIALAGSPNCANLRVLRVGNCGIGPEGAKAIAASPHLADLHTLSMYSNPIGVEGAMALAESRYLSNLKYLSLSNVRGKARKALTDRFGDAVRL
jgi:uncharacterized protein (TIGR02996 family)